MASLPEGAGTTPADGDQPTPRQRRDRTHWLYIAVIAAVALGILVGQVFPDFATSLKWLGDAFVGLIRTGEFPPA